MRHCKSLLLHYKLATCAVVLALLSGCSNDDFSDLNQYIASVKVRPKGTIKPLPEIKVVEPFIFKPDDLRDPFKAIKPAEINDENTGTSTAGGIKPDTSRRKEELEAFAQMKQARVLELLSLGFLTDQEAAEELGTGMMSPTAKPLSGTMFYNQSKAAMDPTALANGGDPARRALTGNNATPKKSGGKSQ